MAKFRVTYHNQTSEQDSVGTYRSTRYFIKGNGVHSQVTVNAAAGDEASIKSVLTSNGVSSVGLVIDHVANHDLGIRGGGTELS